MEKFFNFDLIKVLWPRFTESAEYKMSMAPFVDPLKIDKLE